MRGSGRGEEMEQKRLREESSLEMPNRFAQLCVSDSERRRATAGQGKYARNHKQPSFSLHEPIRCVIMKESQNPNSRNAEVSYYHAAIRAFLHQRSRNLHEPCSIKAWLCDGSIGSFGFNEVLRLCLCQADCQFGLSEVHWC